jgi:predicted HD superfamily hydrolase involved in NAD metabolism
MNNFSFPKYRSVYVYLSPFDPCTNFEFYHALSLVVDKKAEVVFMQPCLSFGSPDARQRLGMLKDLLISVPDDRLQWGAFDIVEGGDTTVEVANLTKGYQNLFPDAKLTIAIDENYLKATGLTPTSPHFQGAKVLPLKDKYDTLIQQETTSVSGSFLECPLPILESIGKKRFYFAKIVSLLLKKSRYDHSLSVAKTAYQIAEKNGLCPEMAYTAGMYHDLGKDLEVSLQKEILDEHFPKIYPVEEFAYHQFVSAYYARSFFHVKEKAVLDAIQYHCTGKKKMSALEKCLYVADKVEPTRDFPTEKLRNQCFHNLNEGFVAVLQDQQAYFEKKGIAFKTNRYSQEMYEFYLGK